MITRSSVRAKSRISLSVARLKLYRLCELRPILHLAKEKLPNEAVPDLKEPCSSSLQGNGLVIQVPGGKLQGLSNVFFF